MMQSIPRLWQCASVFLLFRLPMQAFTVFLVFYYFGKPLLLELVWPSPPHEPVQPCRFKFVGARTSDLFRSSLFVLVLPYVLLGIARLLQALSSTFAQLSNCIPHQNAAAALFVECIFWGFSVISAHSYVQLKR